MISLMFFTIFSYRFADLFTEPNLVRDIQKELDQIIQEGIIQITRLLRNTENGISSGTMYADEDEFSKTIQKQKYLRGKNFFMFHKDCTELFGIS